MKRIREKLDELGLIGDLIEIVLAFVLAWLFYQGLAYATGTPMPIVSVVSNSMEPNLHCGDLLFITAGDYNVGDVVIYHRSDIPYTIVHRIIRETPKGYIIKGDNNPRPDPGFVKKSQILGKVRLAIPLLGYPRLALMLLGV